ncbi:Protein N-acetyltransferase, RimJ/RimL family [Maribacter dokdonensis]|uniref:Protein N-acetyltransferase, RimJ/RimL family n=1 Tax=Maribacter dokdonensis TaxID=320912 RepID=A0A1H4USE5_9FLAO|nr:GNAT family N-acetyltransferase [Maribacter dokdonensis]SEC71647.1 Protein N-acetyltransferase, RimJ/RimL family [Maribacter dokdonensis]
MYKNIETERLIIRPINLTDSKFIIELVNSEGWLRFIGNRNISNDDDAEKYIQKILDSPNFYYSVFQLKTTKEPLGIVTFLNRADHKFPDIGFAMLPEYEKNGYTLEASRKYLDEMIKSNRYENIIAITIPDNQKSIKLLMKLGLEYESDYVGDNDTFSVFSLNAGKKAGR